MNDLPRLPIDDQIKLYHAVRNNESLYKECILKGTLVPWEIAFYLACDEFKTCDPETQKTKQMALKLSPRQECVLVRGESGTGKELIARILHGQRQGSFVAVNTCAVTDTLFESELFGHVRGSFTGADRDRDGLIKQTEGEKGEQGTLFLDEIGDMPLHLQPKILRMIQNRTFRRVGSNVDLHVKCRIVAATHRDLRQLITEGKFRLDLYERLNVFTLHLNPLRQRTCDITLLLNSHMQLLEHILKLYKESGKTEFLSGNVRQLLNLKLRYEVFGLEAITMEDIL